MPGYKGAISPDSRVIAPARRAERKLLLPVSTSADGAATELPLGTGAITLSWQVWDYRSPYMNYKFRPARTRLGTFSVRFQKRKLWWGEIDTFEGEELLWAFPTLYNDLVGIRNHKEFTDAFAFVHPQVAFQRYQYEMPRPLFNNVQITMEKDCEIIAWLEFHVLELAERMREDGIPLANKPIEEVNFEEEGSGEQKVLSPSVPEISPPFDGESDGGDSDEGRETPEPEPDPPPPSGKFRVRYTQCSPKAPRDVIVNGRPEITSQPFPIGYEGFPPEQQFCVNYSIIGAVRDGEPVEITQI